MVVVGRNFGEAYAVDFGTEAATSYTVNSGGMITAHSPAGTGTVDVIVHTPQGASAPGAIDRFKYLPVVNAVEPGSAPAGGGTSLTLTGTDLGDVTAVYLGTAAASGVTVNSATSVTAVAPAHAAGRVPITVVSTEGTSLPARGLFRFTPTISSVTPSSGPAAGGTPVTVIGTGFAVGAGGTVIMIGGKRAPSVSCPTSTECTAVSPRFLPTYVFTGQVGVSALVGGVYSPPARAQYNYEGVFLVNREGRRLLAGTGLQLRDALSGGESVCYPYVRGYLAANQGEPEVIGEEAVAYGECDARAWFGGLPGQFTLSIDAAGHATTSGGGVTSPYGCIYEGSELSGALELGYLSVEVGGTFKSRPNGEQERLTAELDWVESEIALLEEAELTAEEPQLGELQTEVAHLRIEQASLEQQLSEHECEPTTRVGMTVEAPQVVVVQLG